MSHIVVLGAGMQGRAAVYNLCRQEAVQKVTVIDMDEDNLSSLTDCFPHPKLATLHGSMDQLNPEEEPLRSARIVINMISQWVEEEVLNLCFRSQCAYISTNYGHQVRSRHGEATKAGIAVLPEMGMDPGIDLLVCVDLLEGMEEVRLLDSYGTGLPTPEFRNNPIDYKVTWTFNGVLGTYRRSGKVVRDGKPVDVPHHEQYRAVTHQVEVAELGALEAYLNGDAWAFVKLLGLEGQVREAGRYSLRYPGHCAFWEKISRLGLIDPEPREDLGNLSPREVFRRIVEPRLTLARDEKDAIYIRVVAEGLARGKAVRRMVEVYDERDLETGLTAMSRTVGFTAAIAAGMMLEGLIQGAGVLSPLKDVPIQPFLERLKKWGIHWRKSEQPL